MCGYNSSALLKTGITPGFGGPKTIDFQLAIQGLVRSLLYDSWMGLVSRGERTGTMVL